MRRIFKFFGIIIIVSIALFYSTIGIFYFSEHIKGNRYVNYLEDHKLEVGDDKNFSFDEDFYKNQLFMVGEIHGFSKSPKLDYQLFIHLNKKEGVRYYMAEVDYSQAYFLNQYLKTGSDSLLSHALNNFIPVLPRNNKEYLDKWRNLYTYNKTLSESNKIHIIGSDAIVDFALTQEHLTEIIKNTTLQRAIGFNKNNRDDLVQYAEEVINDQKSLNVAKKELGDLYFDYLHIIKNLIQTKENGREHKVFENFREIYKHLNLDDKKVYAYYGLGHVLQAPLKNGAESLAYLIKTSGLSMGKNMVTLTMTYIDSKIIMPSYVLPSFLRTGETWTELDFSYESILVYHQYGIKDLKRTSNSNSTTIYRLDGENSPYANSDRLLSQDMILPFLKNQKMEILPEFATTDYTQYFILIRDSEAAKPYNL